MSFQSPRKLQNAGIEMYKVIYHLTIPKDKNIKHPGRRDKICKNPFVIFKRTRHTRAWKDLFAEEAISQETKMLFGATYCHDDSHWLATADKAFKCKNN